MSFRIETVKTGRSVELQFFVEASAAALDGFSGVGSFEFRVQINTEQLAYISGSVKGPSGLNVLVNEKFADLGLLAVGGFGIPDFAELDKPIISITADIVGDTGFAELALSDIYIDGKGVDDNALLTPFTQVIALDDGRNEMLGTFEADALIGTASADAISALSGNDTITGDAGDDVINGGAGVDTAVLSGQRSATTLTLDGSLVVVQDRRPDGDGTDTLLNMEFLDFADDSVEPFDLQKFAGTTGLTATDFENFIELYIAYFNRAPDAVGLNFWGTAYANGTTLEDMARLFVDQDETRATYPEGTSNLDFATSVYSNVLGRTPDQLGLEFWVDLLDGGKVTRDQFILEVLRGAKSDLKPELGQDFVDQQLADKSYLDAKIDVGAYFAVHKGMSDVENAQAVMELFDGSDASLDAAIAAADEFYQAALEPTDGEFLMKVVGVLDDPLSF